MKSIDVTDPLDLALNKLSILAFAVHGIAECMYLEKQFVGELTDAIYDVQAEINETLSRFKQYEDEQRESL